MAASTDPSTPMIGLPKQKTAAAGMFSGGVMDPSQQIDWSQVARAVSKPAATTAGASQQPGAQGAPGQATLRRYGLIGAGPSRGAGSTGY
ncbi:MAG: hypothetical protein WC789_10620 [Lentisphaeria bacterium]